MTKVYHIPSISDKPLIPATIDGKNFTNDFKEFFNDFYEVIQHEDHFAFYDGYGTLFSCRYAFNTLFCKHDGNLQSVEDFASVIDTILGDFNEDFARHNYVAKYNHINGTCMMVDFYLIMDEDEIPADDLKHAIHK